MSEPKESATEDAQRLIAALKSSGLFDRQSDQATMAACLFMAARGFHLEQGFSAIQALTTIKRVVQRMTDIELTSGMLQSMLNEEAKPS